MDEVHYLISDASKKVDVEAHVLRYWEEELELDIPRNEMGHRYYTDLHIRLFKQVKNLKEKGYQLKAIKHALNQVLKKDGKAQGELSDEILERDMNAALKEFKEEEQYNDPQHCEGRWRVRGRHGREDGTVSADHEPDYRTCPGSEQ